MTRSERRSSLIVRIDLSAAHLGVLSGKLTKLHIDLCYEQFDRCLSFQPSPAEVGWQVKFNKSS